MSEWPSALRVDFISFLATVRALAIFSGLDADFGGRACFKVAYLFRDQASLSLDDAAAWKDAANAARAATGAAENEV